MNAVLLYELTNGPSVPNAVLMGFKWQRLFTKSEISELSTLHSYFLNIDVTIPLMTGADAEYELKFFNYIINTFI